MADRNQGHKWGGMWGKGMPSPPTRASGERRELLQWVQDGAPATNTFLTYFMATERFVFLSCTIISRPPRGVSR